MAAILRTVRTSVTLRLIHRLLHRLCTIYRGGGLADNQQTIVLSSSQRNTNQLPRWVKTMPLFYALMLAASYLWPKLKPALLTE